MNMQTRAAEQQRSPSYGGKASEVAYTRQVGSGLFAASQQEDHPKSLRTPLHL